MKVATRQAPPSKEKTAAPKGPQYIVPFIRAAHEHTEGAFADVTFTPGAATQNLGTFDVAAYGFIRHVWILVSTSGGTAGPGVLAADAPWNVLNDVVLTDINGAEIVHLTGFDLMLANLYGGYAFMPDPAFPPDAIAAGASAVVGFTFALRVPVEVTGARDGFGALSNMNAAQALKLRLVGETSGNVWSTAPTTVPAVRVRCFLEAWTNPPEKDLLGNQQEVMPPGHGSTQFWTSFVKNVVAGAQSIVLPRVGNLLRTVILVARDNTGARSTSIFPDPFTLNWDTRTIFQMSRFHLRALTAERSFIGAAAATNLQTAPAGVFVLDYSHDGDNHLGAEDRHLYLPTVEATRLEIQGTFTGSPGTLKVITNDIAPQRGR